MRILDRLVAGTFLKIFLVFVLTAPLLFVLGDINEQLDRYVDRGLTALEVAEAYVFMFPNFVLWSFPIAALVAAVFTVHGMTTHLEIVAAKAGGISFHRLVVPILILGTLITMAGLALAELVPRSNRIAAGILRNEQSRREWRSDFVYQTEDGRLLSVGRLAVSQSKLTSVVMEDPPDEPGVPTIHIHASEALYDTAGAGTDSTAAPWTFRHGHLRTLYEDGTETAIRFVSLRVPGFTERPDELLREPRDEEEMTYEEMGRLAAIIERTGGEPHKLKVKKEQRLAIPTATLVIILFGAPLATSAKRGGAAFGVGLSLGTTIFYLLLFKIAGAFGASGALPPLVAAWIPNVLFLGLGIWLWFRVRT